MTLNEESGSSGVQGNTCECLFFRSRGQGVSIYERGPSFRYFQNSEALSAQHLASIDSVANIVLFSSSSAYPCGMTASFTPAPKYIGSSPSSVDCSVLVSTRRRQLITYWVIKAAKLSRLDGRDASGD